MVTMKENR